MLEGIREGNQGAVEVAEVEEEVKS
jgi:hypothetical protein